MVTSKLFLSWETRDLRVSSFPFSMIIFVFTPGSKDILALILSEIGSKDKLLIPHFKCNWMYKSTHPQWMIPPPCLQNKDLPLPLYSTPPITCNIIEEYLYSTMVLSSIAKANTYRKQQKQGNICISCVCVYVWMYWISYSEFAMLTKTIVEYSFKN